MRTRKEIQLVHDMLIAVIRGEVDIAAPADLKYCMVWNASVLCWALDHNRIHPGRCIAGLEFAKCVGELRENLARHGYAPAPIPGKKLGALRVDGLHVFAFDPDGKQIPELQTSVADLLAEAGESLGWEMEGQVIETRGGGDWQLFRNPEGGWNRKEVK